MIHIYVYQNASILFSCLKNKFVNIAKLWKKLTTFRLRPSKIVIYLVTIYLKKNGNLIWFVVVLVVTEFKWVFYCKLPLMVRFVRWFVFCKVWTVLIFTTACVKFMAIMLWMTVLWEIDTGNSGIVQFCMTK